MRHFFAILCLFLATPMHASVLATFSQGDTTDSRIDRLPAIALEPGAPATPFLDRGPFSVTWTGQLTLEKRSRLYFSFAGTGDATLTIDGNAIHNESGALGATESERIRLNPGTHKISVTYEPAASAPAEFRLMWRGRKFPLEPVPASAFGEIEHDDSLRHGRYLFARHGCAKCHTSDVAPAMPEALAPARPMTGIGSRVSEEWLTRWISRPAALKPDTEMPALLDHRTHDGAQASADIAAYLATLTTEAPEPLAADADEAKGAHIFHSLGCIACHTAPFVDQPDSKLGRLPLNNVDTKYQSGALRDFLLDPAPSQMPDFDLTAEQATHLAAFLRKESRGHHTPDPAEFPSGDASRGKDLVAQNNCATCHSDLEPAATTKVKTLAELDWDAHGCLAPDYKNGPAPELNLTAADRAALLTYGKSRSPHNFVDQTRTVHAEYATRALTAQRCTHCHSYDGEPAVISQTHIESQRLLPEGSTKEKEVDQSLPSLTHAGYKLHSSYIEALLQGDTTARARPWLDIKMPAFSCDHTALATGIAHQHGFPSSAFDPAPTGPHAEIGKTLIGAQGGFACTTCHAAGDQAAIAMFEVAGINFDLVPRRLRPDFYYLWMHDPRRIDPATKMPRYTQPDGKSILPMHLEGDSRLQFEAILDHIKSLK